MRIIEWHWRCTASLAAAAVGVGAVGIDGVASAAGEEIPARLLSGGVVHTISGEVISPGQVLMRGGRIAAVGGRVDGGGAEVINLDGHHLYPGLVAAGSALGLTEINAVRATRDDSEVGQFTPDVRAWQAVNPDSELIPVARANGITHAQVVPSGGEVAGLSGVVKLDGWTTEEMTVRAPAGLHVVWPSMELDTRPKDEWKDPKKWKSLEEQGRERRAKLRELDEFFLEAEAYAKAKAAGGGSLDVVPAWEAMLPFVRGEIPVFVHADEIRQIRAALEWIDRRGYRMVLMGGRDAGEVAGELATARIPVIFDSVFALPPRDSTNYDIQFRMPMQLHRAGVKVAFVAGDRFGAAGLRNLPYAAAQAVAHGLPPEEAVKGITLYPAEICRVNDRLGSIESGKEATLIAVDGDILDIRSNVKRMWIAGREVPLDSRHTRLYEKFRRRPRN